MNNCIKQSVQYHVKLNGGGKINSTLLMLMMMMNSLSNNDDVTLKIETFDGQKKNLQFKDTRDLSLFLETDFEVVDVLAPQDVLPEVRNLLKRQDIMDVSRNAFIKINKKIEDATESHSDDQSRSQDTRKPKVYDFNIHEKDVQVI